MLVVGVRELKNRLTYYLKLTRQGNRVLVTDRDTPIAIIRRIDAAPKSAGIEDLLASLAKRGLVRLPLKRTKLQKTGRACVRGKPMSRMIIESRR